MEEAGGLTSRRDSCRCDSQVSLEQYLKLVFPVNSHLWGKSVIAHSGYILQGKITGSGDEVH